MLDRAPLRWSSMTTLLVTCSAKRNSPRLPTIGGSQCIGGGFAPTTRFSASCARSAGVPASWARFLTVNRRSTSPPRGCATSPARRGLRRGISISSCFRTSRWEVPSPREPGPGASQPNQKCERIWTLPICDSLHEHSRRAFPRPPFPPALGGAAQAKPTQLLDHSDGLLPRCGDRRRGSHGRDLPHLGRGHAAEDVAVSR